MKVFKSPGLQCSTGAQHRPSVRRHGTIPRFNPIAEPERQRASDQVQQSLAGKLGRRFGFRESSCDSLGRLATPSKDAKIFAETVFDRRPPCPPHAGLSRAPLRRREKAWRGPRGLPVSGLRLGCGTRRPAPSAQPLRNAQRYSPKSRLEALLPCSARGHAAQADQSRAAWTALDSRGSTSFNGGLRISRGTLWK